MLVKGQSMTHMENKDNVIDIYVGDHPKCNCKYNPLSGKMVNVTGL